MPRAAAAPILLARILLALALLGAAAPAALAKGGEAPPKPQTVALEAVALPIVVDGRLINYVFCNIRLDLSPAADGAVVRAKEQFFRDDLVRVGHRRPFVRPDDYSRVDEARVQAELLRYAGALLGPGVVRSAAITRQTSQHLTTLPAAPLARKADIIP